MNQTFVYGKSCVLITVMFCLTSSDLMAENLKEKSAKSKDLAIGSCITEKIREASVMSNFGGNKSKPVKEVCEDEKAANPKEFEKKYGEKQKGRSTTPG